MTKTTTQNVQVVVIGAGISGLIALKYLARAGLSAVALEKADGVGGLWRDLPSWQDIQMSPLDWTINGLAMDGVDQTAVVNNIKLFSKEYQLEDSIRLGEAVLSIFRDDGQWVVQTEKGQWRCRSVVCCSGAHNRPVVPDLIRRDVGLVETHSARLNDPASLRGQRVAIVGAGPSAFDLIEMAFQQGAREVHWVYRSMRWMFPTKRSKHEKASLRLMALQQMKGVRASTFTRIYRETLPDKYRFFGIEAIMPTRPFDYEKDQLVPGRVGVIENFAKIHRHESMIQSIEGQTVSLENGEAFMADQVIYGTGYAMDLRFLKLPEYDSIKSSEALRDHCYSLMKAPDYPELYFLGTVLDTNGTTPLNISMMCRTLVSVLQGKVRLPKVIVKKKINHWQLLEFFAGFDRANYFPVLWRMKYWLLARRFFKATDRPVDFDA